MRSKQFWLVCTNFFYGKKHQAVNRDPLPWEYLWHSCCVGFLLPVQREGNCWKLTLHHIARIFCKRYSHAHALTQVRRRRHSLIFVSRHRFRSKLSRRITMTHAQTKNRLLSASSRLFFFWTVQQSQRTVAHFTVHLKSHRLHSNCESYEEVQARRWLIS